jgi:hypothetical protein
MFSAIYIIKLTALLAGLFALQVAATDFDIDRGSVDLQIPDQTRAQSVKEQEPWGDFGRAHWQFIFDGEGYTAEEFKYYIYPPSTRKKDWKKLKPTVTITVSIAFGNIRGSADIL